MKSLNLKRKSYPKRNVNTRLVRIDGEVMTMADAARRAGIPYELACQRVRDGVRTWAALSAPKHGGKAAPK
jgi:hypothetical protein